MTSERHHRMWVIRFAVWLAWRTLVLYGRAVLFMVAGLLIALLALAPVATLLRVLGTRPPDILFFADLGIAITIGLAGIPLYLRRRKEGRLVASHDPHPYAALLFVVSLTLVGAWRVAPTFGPELPTDLVGFLAGIFVGLALVTLLFQAAPPHAIPDDPTPASPVS